MTPLYHKKSLSSSPLAHEVFPNTPSGCPSCGCSSLNFIRLQPPSPHYGCYKCAGCDCFRGWVPKPETKQRREELQGAIAQLLGSPHISEWERGFLTGIKNQPKLSPRQREILSQIQARVGGQG